jgi:hypothetical protein
MKDEKSSYEELKRRAPLCEECKQEPARYRMRYGHKTGKDGDREIGVCGQCQTRLYRQDLGIGGRFWHGEGASRGLWARNEYCKDMAVEYVQEVIKGKSFEDGMAELFGSTAEWPYDLANMIDRYNLTLAKDTTEVAA